MAFMAVRDFECDLCGQQFPLLSGDLMPGPFFCDDCLREVWSLEAGQLEKYVTACLDEKDSNISKDQIVLTINRYRSGDTDIEDVIAQRERGRQGIFW